MLRFFVVVVVLPLSLSIRNHLKWKWCKFHSVPKCVIAIRGHLNNWQQCEMRTFSAASYVQNNTNREKRRQRTKDSQISIIYDGQWTRVKTKKKANDRESMVTMIDETIRIQTKNTNKRIKIVSKSFWNCFKE